MSSDAGVAALTDGDLARHIAGTADATLAEAELVQRFVRRVRLYGLRHLRNADSADDLAQRVLLLTLEKLRRGEVREPDRIGSFVLGVARQLVHDHRRTARDEVEITDDGHGALAVEPTEPDPLALARLARCLQALAERERTVVVLTYYGDSSANDIARTLSVASGHVRVLRHRAINRLRRCLGVERAS
jgi:RNA polymerase sigma-70 factor (ECF subfamily)